MLKIGRRSNEWSATHRVATWGSSFVLGLAACACSGESPGATDTEPELYARGVTPGEVTLVSDVIVSSAPRTIVAGLDRVWMSDSKAAKVWSIATDGTLSSASVAMVEGENLDIGPTADGDVWFASGRRDLARLGRISSELEIAADAFPNGDGARRVAASPDGNVWFTEQTGSRVGFVTPDFEVTELDVPSGKPFDISVAADGNAWFTEPAENVIGRVTPAGVVTLFDLPTANSAPSRLTPGPDSKMWFAAVGAGSIGSIDADGNVTEYPVELAAGRTLGSLTGGPDGGIWFTEVGAPRTDRVIRHMTTSGAFSTVTLPVVQDRYQGGLPVSPEPTDITAGPDGQMWVTAQLSPFEDSVVLRIAPID